MPPAPSSDKNTIVIAVAALVVVLLGFFYYKYYYTSPLEKVFKPPPVTAPLPELKDLRFVRGEITQIVGKTMTVRVNKLVGQNFESSKAVPEEYKVVIGDKTELLKLTFPSGPFAQPKPAKIKPKDFKKGDTVTVYTDKNLTETKEFMATKIELQS